MSVHTDLNEKSLRNWVQLNLIQGLGPRLRKRLLDRFQTPERILSATELQLVEIHGVGQQLATRISNSTQKMRAEAEIQRCRENGIRLLVENSDDYPEHLKYIPDPPGVLYCKGELLGSDALSIAIVGTRHASAYGLGNAERLSSELARAGFTIVSGLARGIDTAVHRAVLDCGGRTLAVLGSGLANIYPGENRKLANDISESGAVLTEFELNHKPKRQSFPQRNRIVTGLSLGVIVIEAPLRSGAMISAQHALEQNREVFVLPGRVDSRTSAGCHQLIRQGATLIENIDHVLEELGPLQTRIVDQSGHNLQHPVEVKLNEQERCILDAMGSEATSIDLVVEITGLPVGRVLSTISVLETKRMLQRIGGNQIVRNQVRM